MVTLTCVPTVVEASTHRLLKVSLALSTPAAGVPVRGYLSMYFCPAATLILLNCVVVTLPPALVMTRDGVPVAGVVPSVLSTTKVTMFSVALSGCPAVYPPVKPLSSKR